MNIKQRLSLFPFNPAKVPFFYGWVILAAATVGILVSAPGQTMGVSTFTDYLLDSIGLSRNQLSTAYMVGTIGSSLILTYAGKLYDKYGARWVGMGVSLMLAGVLLLLSQSDRIIRFFISDNQATVYVAFAMGILMFLFFMLRFSGQGVLTMVSRNMLMKWFVARRGLVNGISSVFVAMGFSMAPLTFDLLIQDTSWRMAWILMAIFIGTVFTIFVFLFFRDNPEDVGLVPDGEKHSKKHANVSVQPVRQFTLQEARRNMSFWIFAIALSLYSLYVTGFTFHLVSVFEKAGLDRDKALAIFIPVSIISVSVSLLGGWVSDRIKLKYLLYFMLFGEIVALVCLGNLNGGLFYWGYILGNGIVGGLFNVLMAVTWPRFYGRENLGRITGLVMSLIVFGSALGPVLLSLSLSVTGSYHPAFYILSVVVLVLVVFSVKADNPQDSFTSVQ